MTFDEVLAQVTALLQREGRVSYQALKMGLACLWQQQGKHHAARDILSEIYGWFTEGFDIKDLQEAKALLAELA